MAGANNTAILENALSTLAALTDQVAMLSKVIMTGSEGLTAHETELTTNDAWLAGHMLSEIASKQRSALDSIEKLNEGAIE
jgi:hypothetical protein